MVRGLEMAEHENGFSDFFDSIFKHPLNAQPVTGEDIEQVITLTLKEAYTGCTRMFNLQSEEVCPTCRGAGQGQSYICTNCNGRGMIPHNKRIKVMIPAGVDNGNKVRVQGEGQPGRYGGHRGDLYLLIAVTLDTIFERRGNDLYAAINLDQNIAWRGGKIPVPLLDGSTFSLIIPPATPSGKIFRITREGMPPLRRDEDYGDLFVEVRIQQQIKVFYCYAHEDRSLRDELDIHISSLKRLGQITGWYDRDIQAGTEWEHEIEAQQNSSGIILLLVSPNFIASDYCYTVEMQRALDLHRRGRACVIPVILRPTYWQDTPIGKLQALPSEGKPITRWPDRDEAFLEVVKGIHDIVKTLT
jgi:DnaJ-class molecular chaperone